MPAKSKAQQRLFAAAAHGASFPKAKQVQRTMTQTQLEDFARTTTKDLPRHVRRTGNHFGRI